MSKGYAEQTGITQNRAEKVLGDNLRYYVDKDFQEKAKANGFVPDDSVLEVLAESLEGDDYLTGDLPVVEPNYSTEDVINGVKDYENKQSLAFNNSLIGGDALIGEASDKTGSDQVVREFYDQNYPISATDDDKALMEFGRQAGILKETKQTAEDVKDGVIHLLTSNPLETAPQVINGIIDETFDAITDVGQYASDKVKPIEEKDIASNLAARAGDFYEAGVLKGEGQVKTSVLGIEVATSVLGAGKVVSTGIKQIPKKEVPKANASGDNGSFNGDGEFSTPDRNVIPVTNKNVQIASGKYDYMFGRVTSGSHNTARSLQLKDELAKVGIHDTLSDRNVILNHLDDVVNDPSNITDKFTKTVDGKVLKFETRQSLFSGSGGFLQFNSTFKVNADGTRTLSTIIPKGGS
ncbi:hypothetical protein Mar181_1816 [Marinomonas posidonica IVIA-Po-181]|uniref:Uncharacterized protein n=1 Tax=Marinomonas posidonica (strain CECT 7376 / NCIMB 14433 / IVIA-Po-181) TaxID=491952 RepID=F6D147_MARPP|nr:hypothetical protein Mar181_1816 [Marinomonas posidonica IVIA-Po-181]